MVMSNDQALSLIAAAQEAASNGVEVPAELRCQYPSKRCDHVRTTKRGGGLHRLCSFHRQRANKNQWLVDQRRRMRREHNGSPTSGRSSPSGSPKSAPSSPTASDTESCIMDSLDVLDSSTVCAPLGDDDLHILKALLFDTEYDALSDGFVTDASMDWSI